MPQQQTRFNLIGNVKAEIRFSNTVTNINGAEASNYNEGTSAIGPLADYHRQE